LDKNSTIYSILRWGYQPIRASRRLATEWGRLPRKRRLLAETSVFKALHFGCGPFRIPGWINVDFAGAGADFWVDITRRLPFPNNIFDAMYGSEVIEHVELVEARAFLAEALRVLKPGGTIRMTTPDLVEMCRIYLGLNPAVAVEDFREGWREGEFSPEIWVNSVFNGYGHKHIYTFESLSTELDRAGFKQIQRCAPQVTHSRLSQLANLEQRHGENPPPFVFAPTLIIEAEKPLN
jgi:predicted SAM-dependent methyltransferase